MAFCFLLLLNPFVFGAVTLFHVQLLVSFAIILTSGVVSIFTGLPNPVGISVSFRGFYCYFPCREKLEGIEHHK